MRSILLRPDSPAVIVLGHFSPQVHEQNGFAGPDHWHSVVSQFYDVPHIRCPLLPFRISSSCPVRMLTHCNVLIAPRLLYILLTLPRLPPSTDIMPTLSWPIPRVIPSLRTCSLRMSNLRFASRGAQHGAPVPLCPCITRSARRSATRLKMRRACLAARAYAKAVPSLTTPTPRGRGC